MPIKKRTTWPDPSLPWQGRPGPNTKTRKVWEIADILYQEHGRIPSRQEVIGRCAAEGGDVGTASTQFYHWRQAKAALDAVPDARTRESNSRGARLGEWLPVSAEGQVSIPHHLLAAMRLDPTREVLAEVVDGELRLVSAPVALEQVRRLVRKQDTGRGSVVDEFIAERRAEAARE